MNTQSNSNKTSRAPALASVILGASCLLSAGLANANTLNLSDVPLFVSQAVAPLTMLVMARDHKLYYEAYNDATDLTGDGTLNTKYAPSIDYYGYFDSHKCYNYNSSGPRFVPNTVTQDKTCSGEWSGDYLNYLTTSRMDALRKVLFGGYRSQDTSSETDLERAYIPQDAHSWGKEYTSIATDGYDISKYTPFSAPNNGNRHLFANTTLLNGDGKPLLRVALNQPYRIWEWVSIERPVAGDRVQHGSNGPNISNSITDYVVRVRVCKDGLLEDNCKLYPSGNYKPVGLLQDFGENNKMKFGLLTGSYEKNMSGGVLRKNISSITDEIDANTGEFTSTVGIIKTIERLKVTGFGGDYMHESNCGFIFDGDIVDGQCRMWGNPIAEMMYESIRYFAGKLSPSAAFATSGGDDAALGLPNPNWIDPYDSNNNPRCSKPNMLVISDINPSYDSDQIPGSAFGSYSGDLSPSLNASSLGQTIWDNEFGSTLNSFIGESGILNDGTPSPKAVSSFGNIRGLSPEEPNKQGSYYAASVAYYGMKNDIHTAPGEQKVNTFSVALSSPIPEINIKVDGKTVKLIPFAKSVGGCRGVKSEEGEFQPTNSIVDFYVEQLTDTSGTFRINFEDAQQGADHDMDAVVKYHYQVNPDNTLDVTLDSTYAAGCIIQHLGYVISGTTADGVYLEVRDSDTDENEDVDYFLDTPPNSTPGSNWEDGEALPLNTTRTFTPSSEASANLLKNPLYYAAKWGSFEDMNNNGIPDQQNEWDKNKDGIPDNYFLVTNATTLKAQLAKALNKIIARNTSAASAAINSGVLNSDSRLYQALFNSADWTGQLVSYPLDTNTGAVLMGSGWDAGEALKNQNPDTGRQIITYKPSASKGIAFRWPSNESNPGANDIDASQVTALNLNPDTLSNDGFGEARLDYIRGSTAQPSGTNFRARNSILGDIINSSPIYVGAPNSRYSDIWPDGDAENTYPYSAYKTAQKDREKIIYVGANDGMLHAFKASTGQEEFAFVPSSVYSNLSQLSSSNYAHKYFVDGAPSTSDVFYANAWHTVLVGGLNKGGKGIYAIDVTDPSNFSESNASNLVLWEFTDADDADLGYTFSQPAIVRLHNGKWAAIFGNGYNNTENDGHPSSTGNAVLYIVDIETGNLIVKIDTEAGMSQDPLNQGRANGLATPAAIDVDGDQLVDYVYAGDLFGNLWKFDLNDSNPSKWKVAFNQGNTPQPLFVAKDANNNPQPITSRPEATLLPNSLGGTMVFFGTGQYLEAADKSTTETQTFYAIEDENSNQISGRNQLLQQSILGEVSVTDANGSSSDYRITSDYIQSNGKKGWFMDLNIAGERVVSDPVMRNLKIIFTTMIPSGDVCGFGGTGWLMEIDAFNGSRLKQSPFDLTGDKLFSNADTVTYDNSNVTVSGKKSNVGIIPTPGIVSSDKQEYKYLPGTSGNIESFSENPEPVGIGRKSWRQLK